MKVIMNVIIELFDCFCDVFVLYVYSIERGCVCSNGMIQMRWKPIRSTIKVNYVL